MEVAGTECIAAEVRTGILTESVLEEMAPQSLKWAQV